MKELIYLIICVVFLVSSIISGSSIIDEFRSSDNSFIVAFAIIIVGAIPSLILGFFLKWNFSTLLYERIFKIYYTLFSIGAGIIVIIFLSCVLSSIGQTILEWLDKK